MYFLMVLPFFVGCVGPTSPFGAIDPMESDFNQENKGHSGAKVFIPDELQSQGLYQVEFSPDRQVIHDKADFSIEIKSPFIIPENLKIKVTHNGVNVSQAFLANAVEHRSSDGKSLLYIYKNLRLKTLDTNQIQVKLFEGEKSVLARDYKSPACSLFQTRKLAHIGAFRAPDHYMDLIEKVAKEYEKNPSFLAGIVAQESGFNPQAVSWAKAIGLTQMTPLAEKQVLPKVKTWPRYPGINHLSYLSLRSKIRRGEINNEKEWRLDPEMSLKGGMTYVEYLAEYWHMKKHRKLVESLGGDSNLVMTELILASYNSGAARVKNAIIEKGNQWKKHPKLQEAVKYLKKVSSYCYHYGERTNENVDET